MAKKLYEFAHLHQPRLFASEDIARGVEKKLDALDGIHRTALTSVTSIRESKDLTAKGKQTALKELEAEIVKKTKEWQQGNGHYADYAKQLEKKMQPKRHRQDDQVYESRQREIRDHFHLLDPIMQEAAYRQAAEKGNDQFLEAIEHSPWPIEFSTQAQIDKIRDAQLSRQYPEQAQTLKDVRMAQTQVDSALKSVGADLRKHKLEILGDAPVVGVAA